MNIRQIAEIYKQAEGSCFNLRSLFAALLAAGVISNVQAAPEGGVVRAGNALISEQGSTTLIQQSSQRAVIDWRGFSTAKDELVQFIQPSASSATLNRVTGDQVSLLMGQLNANGQILLINPNGIILGGSAQINVGSLIASTANLGNNNFMQGRLIFDQPGKYGAGIINAGRITAAEGGLVALVAPHVRNDGLIQARLGKVMLGAADTFTIDLYGDGLVNLALSDASLAQMHDAQGQAVTSLIAQTGKIDVSAGQAILVTAKAAKGVLDSLINMSGTIIADSAVQQGGRILLLAKGGNVDVSGALSAQGGSGGQIEVLGDQVHLSATAQLDASGAYGGGVLHVGGAYQGSGDTYRAQDTQIDAGAKLNASATSRGNGGEVIVWSDGGTHYDGSIMARGGAQGGNGGRVEVSGKQTLAFDGYVDAGASNGYSGSLLLDPTDFTVGMNEAGLIDRVLRTGTSTTVSASGDINVNYAIDGRGRLSGGGLTLSAGNNVNVNDFIVTHNGAINLFAATGTVNLAPGKVVYAGTAPITVRSGATLANAPYLTSGLLSLISTLGSVNIDSAIDSTIGNLFVQAEEDVNVNQPIVSISDGNSLTVTAGHDIKVNALIDGRPALNGNPNGTVTMSAVQSIDLNKSILAHSIDLTATTGTINAPTMTASTVTLDGDGIPHGEGLFAGDGPISVTSGGTLSSGIYVTTGTVDIRSTGGNVIVDTKLAEILGDVSIRADAGSVNVDQEIANIRSGSSLSITAGTDINLNRQIDALDDSNPLSITPVPGGSVTFSAGNNVNLNRDLATYDGAVDITATAGTLNIAWNAADSRTYRIGSGSTPISVTAGGNLSTGTSVPNGLTFAPCLPDCDTTEKENTYIVDQLKPWVALVTTGKLTLESTGGDVSVDAPIPGDTGEIEVTAADAIVVNHKLLSNSQPITLNAGAGGITVNATDDSYGVGHGIYPSIYSGGNLSLNALGNIDINASNGIGSAGTLTIDTRGKILHGSISHHAVPPELVLIADGGIDSFSTLNPGLVNASSLNGSIHLSVYNPGQLIINAYSPTAGDVYTGGYLGALPTIHAGRDINLSNVVSSGNVVLDAGRDVNTGYFARVHSLNVTAGRDVNFNADVPLDPSTSSMWMLGGDFVVTSTGGDINFSNGSAVHLNGTANFTLDAYGSVTMYKLETKGPVAITARTGDITLHNDVGPFVYNPIDTVDPNDYDRPGDSVPAFDPAGEGPYSVTLASTLGNINMQGAQAVNDVFISSGGVLTAAHEIYSNWGDLVITATGGAWEPLIAGDVFHAGPYVQDSRTGGNYWFGNKSIANQVQLDEPVEVAPAISPGPSVAAPAGPGALTALAAQAPNLVNVSGNSVPGTSGGSGSDSENATLNVGGSSLSEIIPEDEGTTVAGQSEDIVLVFEGGRGAAQMLDVGLGGGQSDVDNVLGGHCASGNKSKGSCK